MAHIVVQKNPTGGGSVSWIDVYLHEGERRQITATPNSGYKFSHWNVSDTRIAKLEDNNGSSNNQTYHSSTVYVVSQVESADDKVTITAYFEEISYTFTVYAAEGGGGYTDPAAGTTQSLHKGARIRVTAYPYSGYTFNGWVQIGGGSVNLRDQTTIFTMAASNGGLRPKFVAKTKLTIPTLTISSTSVLYSTASNPNITYTATPGSGQASFIDHYEFSAQDTANGNSWTYKINPYKDYFSMPRIGHIISVKVKAVAKSGSNYTDSEQSTAKTFTICGKVVFYNGTSVVSTKIVSVLPSNQFPTAPTKTGYTFDGWWTAQSGGNQKISCSTDEIRAVGTLNLYAHWKVKSFTIKFISAYGACTPSQDTANYGTVYSLSGKSAPSYSGYRHTGWSKSSGGNKVYGLTDSFTVDGDITLYAYYEANYNVEYNLNAPKSIADNIPFLVTPQSITGGEKIKGQPFQISPVVPTITGYEFVNWTDDDNTAYQPGDNYTKDNGTTLKANWRAKNYTVTYKPSSNGPQFAPFTQSISFNTAPILPDYPNYDRELYRPKNPFWIVQNNGQIVAQGNPGDTYPMIYANDNTVIIPQWTQITYWRGGWLWIYVPEEGGFN